MPSAYFSDRGRSFQADGGRRFSVIAAGPWVRASDGFHLTAAQLRRRLVHGGGRRLRRTTDAVGNSGRTTDSFYAASWSLGNVFQ